MKQARRDVQRAIWSVHFHAAQKRQGVPSRLPGLLPLRTAVDVLFQEYDDHDDHRRDIACRRLADEKIDLVPRSNRDRAASPRFQEVLRARKDDPDAKTVQLAPLQKQARLASQGLPCQVDAQKVEPKYNAETGELELTTTSTVTRPLADVRQVLDPRAWGKCSDFFDPDKTYRIKLDGRRPVKNARGQYVREDGPEKLGESWLGLLRERFDGPGTSVDNILAIDFGVAPREVTLNYALYGCEHCTLGPFADLGGLLQNHGVVKATDRGGGVTEVYVEKHLRFIDFTPGDPGEWIDFGDAMSILTAVLATIEVDDKVVLKLCCDPNNPRH